MLSCPAPITAGAAGAQKKKSCPAQEDGLNSGATMPKSHWRRNAANGLYGRFSEGFGRNWPELLVPSKNGVDKPEPFYEAPTIDRREFIDPW
jgi:hypothetical protein